MKNSAAYLYACGQSVEEQVITSPSTPKRLVQYPDQDPTSFSGTHCCGGVFAVALPNIAKSSKSAASRAIQQLQLGLTTEAKVKSTYNLYPEKTNVP